MPIVSTAAAIEGVKSGRVVSFPTDTVPALAAIASHGEEIFQLKHRSTDKPLILMAATLTELLEFVDTSHAALPIWCRVAEAKFPGAITLVLPINDRGKHLNSGFTTIGVRIPDCSIAIELLQQTGALLTTSANKTNQPPLRQMSSIAAQFPSVLVVADRNPDRISGSGLPSTVLEWTDSGWRLLRQGQVSIADLPPNNLQDFLPEISQI